MALNKNIVILSSVNWGDMLQRPHHIARELSSLGHNVLYFNSDMKYFDSIQGSSNLDVIIQCMASGTKVIDGVRIISAFHSDNVSKGQIIEKFINHYFDNSSFEIIAYLGSQIEIINYLDSVKKDIGVTYDCVDAHLDAEGCPWFKYEDIGFEVQLCKRAKLIITTGVALYTTKKYIEGYKNVALLGNGVNKYDFEINDDKIPEELQDIEQPIIGYVGYIGSWFDEDLFYKVVDMNRDKSFVVIGPKEKDLLIKKRKNLHYLGLKKHSELKDYIKTFNVALVPFKDYMDLIISCNPIKVYEYLACKVPVVSTVMPDILGYSPLVNCDSTAKGFTKLINEALDSRFDAEEYDDIVNKNTWRFISEGIIKYINLVDSGEEVRDDFTSRFVGDIKNGNIVSSVMSPLYDGRTAIELSESGYNKLTCRKTLNNYLYSLYKSGKHELLIKEIEISYLVDGIYKDEIEYLYRNQKEMDILINLIIGRYSYVCDMAKDNIYGKVLYNLFIRSKDAKKILDENSNKLIFNSHLINHLRKVID